MLEIEIKDLADQQLSVVLDNRRITLRFRYNPSADRYTFDLAIDDEFVLRGRKVVTGVDLLAPYALGIGILFAVAMREGAYATRAAIAAGDVKVFHAS